MRLPVSFRILWRTQESLSKLRSFTPRSMDQDYEFLTCLNVVVVASKGIIYFMNLFALWYKDINQMKVPILLEWWLIIERVRWKQHGYKLFSIKGEEPCFGHSKIRRGKYICNHIFVIFGMKCIICIYHDYLCFQITPVKRSWLYYSFRFVEYLLEKHLFRKIRTKIISLLWNIYVFPFYEIFMILSF